MHPIRKVFLKLVTFVSIGLAAAVQTYAGAVQLLSPSELNPADFTAVYPGAPLTVLPSPFNLTAGGITLTFTTSNGNPFERRNQIPPIAGDWDGNFAPGTTLLWTRGANGPVEISFSLPLMELGFKVQQDQYGPQTFTFTAFNGATSLGTFTVSGLSTDLRNDTALFLGVRATDGDLITRVQISSTSNNFAIGPVTFEPIPEPATVLLLGTGLAGIGAAVGKRRKKEE